jgi:acyl-CoA reductase-like NAD-dependent aldehyde dehydrogenase
MAWERRRNGLFYYRSYRDRVTGRVRKEYVGTGPVAEEAARQDAVRRAERAARRCEERAAEQRYETAHAMLLTLAQDCDTLARAALADFGYYQHHRGEWRRYGRKETKGGCPEDSIDRA